MTRFFVIAALIWTIVVGHNYVSSRNTSILLQENDTSYTIKANFTNDEVVENISIFKNGSVFYRAYAHKGEKGLENGLVTFIFDDGWLNTYTNAYPLFKEYDNPATVAVIGSYVNQPQALSNRHLHTLINSGWSLMSHSISDVPLTSLDAQTQANEIRLSKQRLWNDYWGTNYFVYPYGEKDDEIENLARNYYHSTRAYVNGVNEYPINPHDLKIVSLDESTALDEYISIASEAALNKTWVLFVAHHVSDEDVGEFNIRPSELNQLIEHINTKSIPVVTFDEGIQTLDENLSLIKHNTLTWKFNKQLLSSGDKIRVKLNKNFTKTVVIP